MIVNSEFSPITLGRPIRSFELDGFFFTESVYTPFLVLPPHAHELPTISLVRRGSFIETVRRRPRQCDAFTLIVEPPGEVHSDQFGPEGALCFHVTFKPQRIDTRAFSKIFDDAACMRSVGLPALTMRIEHELRFADAASPLAIQSLLFEILARTVRFQTKGASIGLPAWLRRAKDFIHANFAEDMSLQTIADCVGVHPCHLAKAFRKHYRYCVGDYLRRVRLDAAIQLLTTSGSSLAEIATSVGYCDQSHFTNSFKRHTGTTPAKFQTEIRAGKTRTKRLHSSKTC